MSKPRPLPASYVVRLYRADPARLDALAGVIEDVEHGLTTSFRSGTDLLRQLQSGPAVASQTDRTDQPDQTNPDRLPTKES